MERAEAATTRLGNWHANLIHVARRQLVLFVNDQSLLPVVVPSAPGATLLKRFPVAAGNVLARLGVPPSQIHLELAFMAEPRLARTNSRQILGTMNDFVRMLAGEALGDDDLLAASLRLAEAPCGPIGMRSPNEVAVELLGAREGH